MTFGMTIMTTRKTIRFGGAFAGVCMV